MSNQAEHYRSQAMQARAQADRSLLPNVRDRCLRSEAAWAQMAERAERTEQMRLDRESQKASALCD